MYLEFTKKIFIFATLIALLGLPVLSMKPAGAQFDPLKPVCDAASANNDPICQDARTGEDPLLSDTGVLRQVVNILSFVTGIIAVIIIVVSGIQLITSNGDSNAFANARNSIIYAGIGIVIVVVARTLVLYIAGQISL